MKQGNQKNKTQNANAMKFVHSIKTNVYHQLGLLVILLTVFSLSQLRAEGLQQVAPTEDDSPVMLEISRPNFGNFAAYDAAPNSRLQFSIGSLDEIFYFGLSFEHDDEGKPFPGTSSAQYTFRIKNSGGVVVHGPFTVTENNSNINSYNEAVFGNYDVTTTQNGQLMYQFQPANIGDYYIEFKDGVFPDDTGSKINIPFWDFTVTNNNVPIPGRVWSKSWAFRTPEIDGTVAPDCGWDRPFNGTLYSYTTDGFVSKIDFSEAGMQGLSFNVTFNSTGPGISGDLTEDRKSIPNANATATSGEHKIFLSEPDINLFPDGICGEIVTPTSFSCLNQDSFCLAVSVTKPGQVEIILDFNQNGVLDPNTEDVNLVYEFPEGELSACVPWDGLSGMGNPVSVGDTIDLIFFYSQGVQHWSAYDVEFMRNGYCIETIRPICEPNLTSNLLYWDDRNITEDPGNGSVRDGRNGCACESGCRTWDNFNLDINEDCSNFDDDLTTGYGDKSTLNTWWFANTTSVVRVNIPLVQGTITGLDSICPGTNTIWTASDIGASGNVTFSWTGPDNFTSNNAQITVEQEGEYCVIIMDEQGCMTTVCKTLTILDSGSGTIDYPDIINACLGEVVQITPTGNTAGFNFQWSPSTGLDFDNIANPTFTMAGNIVYTVTIENIANGCSFTETVTINQLTQPVPIFTSQSGCDQGLTINFTNNSTSATTYSWDFGDPNTTLDFSNDVNPSYTYPSPGTYIVKLMATSADGCTVSLMQPVTVIDIPLIADFEVSYNNCDANAVEVQFTNTSINGADNTATYNWTFSGGFGNSMEENPTLTVNSPQTILATLIITTTENCTASASESFTIQLGPPADQFPDVLIVCEGIPTQINPGGDPAFTYSWSPAIGIDDVNSPQPTFTPLVSTTYTVTITSFGADECSVVETIDVNIAPDINLQISGAGTFCTPTTVLTATTDVVALIQWFDEDDVLVATGNTFTPALSGTDTYTVVATDPNGCTENSGTVTVSGGPPNIDVPEPAAVCLGEEVILSVSNLDPNDQLTYLWTPAELFVPGTNTLAMPDYIENSGEVIVSVMATNQFGCTVSEDVLVYVPPAIGLEVTGEGTFCAPITTLVATTDIPTTIQWFDENDVLVNTGTTFAVNLSGTHTFTIIADDGTGCPTETAVATVSGGPVNITVPESVAVCLGEEVIVNVTNNDINDQLTYLWTPAELFVPGTNTLAMPDFIENSGEVTVNVLVTNQFGCTESADVLVYVPPAIGLEVTGEGTFCTPTATLTASTAIPATIEWFDESNALVNTGTTHVVELSGCHTFTVVADDGTGCPTESQVVTVCGGPVDISVPDTVAVCLGEEIILGVTNNDGNDNLTYQWEPTELFEPGTANNAMPDYIEVIGEQDVTVTVSNQFDCTATETVRIAVVDPAIDLSFTSEIDCNGGTVVFTNTSTNAFGYVWDFGDGMPLSFEENPVHTYIDDGIYTVTLDIVYDVSCVEEPFSADVMVEEPQIFANFTFDITECSADSAVIAFMDNSTNTLNNTIGWDWTFMDAVPATSDEQNPTVVVSNEGSLTVSLTITSANDCFNTRTEVLEIDLVELDISLTDTIVLCAGDTTVLNLGGDPDLVYSWSPTEFLSDPTATSPIAFPPVTTTYTATAYSTVGTDTCFVSDQVVVFVPADINLMLDQDPVVITCGEDVVITATADTDVSVDWTSVLLGPIGTNTNTITINPFRTDTIIATATDMFGCMAMDTIIIIDNGVDIEVVQGNDIIACQGVDTILNVVNLDEEDVLTYEWSPLENIIGTNMDDTVQIVVNDLGITTFSVIVTNQNDCVDTLEVNVMIQEFDGELADTLYVCYNESTPINPGGNPTYTYNWSPETGLDLTNPENPIATLTEDQLYQVTITDPATGCSDELEILVIVQPDIALETAGTINLCNIEPVELTATTAVETDIEWFFNNELIGTGNSITVTPPGDGCHTYTAVATDPLTGCEQTSEEVICVMEFMGVLPDDPVTVCANEPTPINPNGDPSLIYEWMPEDEFIDLTEPWNPVVTTSMPLTYFLTVTDTLFGCTVMDTVNIEIAPQLNLEISPESVVLCDSVSTTLTANTDFPATSVTWFLLPDDIEIGTGVEVTFIPPGGQSQVYAVAISPDNCTERDTITINNVPIDATITNALIICEATDTEELSVINNDLSQELTVAWDPTGVLTPLDEFTVTVDPNITTEFSATVTNQYGCSETLNTTVTIIDLLGDLSIVADPDTILLGESSTITVSGCVGCSYDWNPPNEDNSVIIFTPTEDELGDNDFLVTVSLLECSLELETSVYVIDDSCDPDHVFFPNAFTPNRDGDNDILRLRSAFLDQLTDMELLIYNRWGEEMFRTTNQYEGWDGTFRNEDLPPDVFGYYLRVVCPNGDELVQKGNVTLLR